MRQAMAERRGTAAGGRGLRHALLGAAAAAALCAAAPAAAQEGRLGFGLGAYGMPGVIDMPTALAMPDGMIGLTADVLPGTARGTLAFQISPRLTGAFRYSRIERPGLGDVLFDRSFDIQYQLLSEGRYRPAVAIGLRDFIGTGAYSSEYIVASKHLAPQLRATGGIGWGRMATRGGFTNPLSIFGDGFRTRPGGFTGTGGRLELNRFFRGDAALFGGLEYQLNDRLRLLAEYSSDAYIVETAPGGSWKPRIPVNLGLSYAVSDRTTIDAHILQGATIGLRASISLDPNRPRGQGRGLVAPVPVGVRPAPAPEGGWPQAWVAMPEVRGLLRSVVVQQFQSEGLRLEGLELSGSRAVVRFSNLRHEAEARAFGRAARVLSAALPPSVEHFVLIGTTHGMAVSAVTLRRTDLELLEHAPDGAAQLLARASIEDAHGKPGVNGFYQEHPPEVPRFGWSITPYVVPSVFDPNAPLRVDVGLRAEGRFALASNMLLSGSVIQRLGGNVAGTPMGPPAPGYERVRTSLPLYSTNRPALERLTFDHFSRPGPDLFGRVTVGHLERMYGGVSAELLWKPVDSRLALGVEVNRVRKRSPDSFAGFGRYEVTTGHVSAYYDFGRGYLGQVDVGQYLAGDRGATLRLEREFASGWKLGAYATLTDMPFSAFGEGSFDKGITLTVPVSWFDGSPTRARNSMVLRSLTRDGGARLEVTNRLYPLVRELQSEGLTTSWGAVWQ